MRYPEVLKTFKEVETLEEIPLKDYYAIGITGGEPWMEYRKVISLAIYIKNFLRKKEVPIYLYTNGVLLQPEHLKEIQEICIVPFDGINIGWHDNAISYEKVIDINKIVPVRILIWEKEITDDFLEFVKEHNIKYRVWKMDECDPINEDRYLLKL